MATAEYLTLLALNCKRIERSFYTFRNKYYYIHIILSPLFLTFFWLSSPGSENKFAVFLTVDFCLILHVDRHNQCKFYSNKTFMFCAYVHCGNSSRDGSPMSLGCCHLSRISEYPFTAAWTSMSSGFRHPDWVSFIRSSIPCHVQPYRVCSMFKKSSYLFITTYLEIVVVYGVSCLPVDVYKSLTSWGEFIRSIKETGTHLRLSANMSFSTWALSQASPS